MLLIPVGKFTEKNSAGNSMKAWFSDDGRWWKGSKLIAQMMVQMVIKGWKSCSRVIVMNPVDLGGSGGTRSFSG